MRQRLARLTRHTLLTLVAGSLACAEREGVPDVTTVTASAPTWAPGKAWQVDSAPAIVLGGTSPASRLQFVVGAMRQSNGLVVVADNGARNLKYFSPDGVLRATIGRQGSGPGEFSYIASLWGCGGDSAFVDDIGQRKVFVYAPNARRVRTFQLLGPERNTAFSTSCNRRGQILTTGWGDMRNHPRGVFRSRVKVAFSSLVGEPTAALGEFAGTEMFGRENDGFPLRAGRWLRVAMGEGMAWVAANDDRHIRGYDMQGRLRLVIQRPGEEPAFSEPDKAMIRQLALDSAANESQRQEVARMLELMPLPDRPPAVSELMADATGHVWVRAFPRADRPNPPWQLFAPDGTWLGEVTTPRDVQVLEIGRDYLLGLRDSPTVGHQVVLHALRRPG